MQRSNGNIVPIGEKAKGGAPFFTEKQKSARLGGAAFEPSGGSGVFERLHSCPAQTKGLKKLPDPTLTGIPVFVAADLWTGVKKNGQTHPAQAALLEAFLGLFWMGGLLFRRLRIMPVFGREYQWTAHSQILCD